MKVRIALCLAISIIRAVEVQGHRGTKHVPENTLAAFQHAIGQGADSVEFDVHVSLDDHVFIVHDSWVVIDGERVGLKDVTYAALKEVGGMSADEFPLLADIVQALHGDHDMHHVILDIEIKSEAPWTKSPSQLVQAVLGVLNNEPVDFKRLRIRSFDPDVLKELRLLAPDIEYIFLTDANDDTWVDQAQQLGVSGVAPWFETVTKELVARAHAFGLYVIPYVVNEDCDFKELVDAGADGITTDYPYKLVTYLKDYYHAKL